MSNLVRKEIGLCIEKEKNAMTLKMKLYSMPITAVKP